MSNDLDSYPFQVISNNHLSGPCMTILSIALIDASAVKHLNLSGKYCVTF